MKETTNKKKIFLSHAYRDKDIATRIIEKLILRVFDINKQTDIFFTSKRETGIESSTNWRNKIKANLNECDIFIALITTNFKNSEMCLGEIGAAWVLDKNIYTLILPPVKYENFSSLIAERQADLLLSKEDVNSFISSIQDQLQELYGIGFKHETNVEKSINDFLKSTKQYLSKNPDIFKPLSFAEKEEQKREAIEEIKNILDNADILVDDEEKKLIKERSKLKWPEDYNMQEYYINEQVQALIDVKKLQSEFKENPEKGGIIQRAIRKWPEDYNMQLYTVNEEINAFLRLN